MDLSMYYEEFRSLYNIALFTMVLTVFVVLFVGVRSILDKKESTGQKLFNWLILIIIFAAVSIYFFSGPFLANKDVTQKTIFCHNGNFEIVEISENLINYKAVFLVNGKELTLKYFEDRDYDFSVIKPGCYEGIIVYAQHTGAVLHIEIHPTVCE